MVPESGATPEPAPWARVKLEVGFRLGIDASEGPTVVATITVVNRHVPPLLALPAALPIDA